MNVDEGRIEAGCLCGVEDWVLVVERSFSWMRSNGFWSAVNSGGNKAQLTVTTVERHYNESIGTGKLILYWGSL